MQNQLFRVTIVRPHDSAIKAGNPESRLSRPPDKVNRIPTRARVRNDLKTPDIVGYEKIKFRSRCDNVI